MISELGYMSDGVYMTDENCKDNLTGIIEMLDQDDQAGSCRKQLAAGEIFKTDLIPLFENKISEQNRAYYCSECHVRCV